MKTKLLLLLTLLVSAFSWGQHSITATGSGSAYTQDFDSYDGNTLPANWTTTATQAGYYNRNTAYVNTNQFYALRENSSSTDKAFGGKLAPNSGTCSGTGTRTLTFTVRNNTGTEINGFVITWNVEQYSQGQRAPSVTLSHNFGGTTTGTLATTASQTGTDGNLSSIVLVASRSATISGLTLANNATGTFTFTFCTGSGSNNNGHIGVDDFSVYATTASTNDVDSEIDGPVLAGQPNPVLISSLVDTDAEAVRVFDFDIYDYGTADGLPTKITQVTIKPGTNNTANWANTIAGVKLSLNGGTTFVTTGTPVITAGSIVIPITSGNLDIADADAQTISMFIYLRNSGLVDNSILEFNIPATSHGFTAHSSGSAFATTFPNATVSNDMLVDVVASKLIIATQPSATACPNTNLATAPVFRATDANNNIDTDYSSSVTISNSGSLGMTNNSTNAIAGVATFTNLQFTATGTVTITAASGVLSNSPASTNIAISVPVVTGVGATNGNAQSVISWANPGCYDEIMIVAKAGSAVTATPTGNGSAYTANLFFNTGTAFDGGFVIYKGSTSPQTLTNLTNGTTYHITFFTRKGTSWSSAVTTTCTPNLASSANNYFRSRVSGNWNAAATWQSSLDNVTWITSTLVPTSSATQIEILNGHTVAINAAGISMTNTFVRNGGILEVTTGSSYDLSGSAGGRNIQLTIDNGGIFSVKSTGFASGNGFGLIKTGGKISADTGSSNVFFIEDYVHYDNGLFYFENAAVCEWNINSYPSSNASSDFVDNLFYPSNIGDLPIFRISNLPANQGYGNSNNDNIIYAILELNTTIPFEIHNNANQKNVYFIGGIRGNGTLIQKTAAGPGQIILGDATHIPELGGNVTIQIRTNRLKLPNGANVTSGANVIIQRNDAATENGLIDRQGGILDVNANGILDITNMRITNTSTGGVTVNGTLRTSNTGGLNGTGSAIVDGTLTINNGSTIDYYATLDQAISSAPSYYNITFSGSGTKTPQNAISVHTNGTVRITGTPIVDFTARNLASTAANSTAFIMDGGRLRLGTGETLPLMQGDYTLTGGVVEYVTGSAAKTIRSKSYQNIEVTGNNVSNSSGNITLNSNGTFTVKTGGIFTINDDAIVGPTGSQTVTIESGAIFKTGDIHGFNGGTGATATSVRSDVENIVLANGSIVEYSRGNPFANGDQTITHFSPAYRNLHISGSGNKTLQHNTATRVNENLEVLASNTATLLVEEGKVITVKQAVKLPNTAGDAKLEIKNNGQLIQIDDLPLANTGTNFIMERIAKVNREDYVYWSSPSDAFTTATIPSTGSRFEWNPLKVNSNGTQGNWVTPTTTMTKGKGYIAKVPNSAPLRPATAGDLTTNFAGKPFNGTVSVDIFRGSRTTAGTNVTEFDDNWNLVGNPYPSAIDALEFLQTNGGNLVDTNPPATPPTIVGAVWVWRHGQSPTNSTDPFYYNFANNYYSSDYIKYNGTGSTPPGFFDGKIAAGQGFMICMKDNVSDTPYAFTPAPTNPIHLGHKNTVVFNNSMRFDDSEVHYNNTQFFRTTNTENNVAASDEKHRIWLDIIKTSNGQTDTALIGYVSNATMGEDNLYDTFFVPRSEVSLYSLINTKSYIIQGRSLPFDTTDLVPLGMKIISAGNHTIAIRQVDGIFEGNQNIYLEDKQLNIIHDLKQSPYHFTAPTGVNNTRFVLRYTTNALGNADFDYDNQVVVFSKNNTVTINSSIQNIDEVQVYDVLGRQLYQNTAVENQEHSFAKDIAQQTIIVKVKLQNGIWVTKKVLVK